MTLLYGIFSAIIPADSMQLTLQLTATEPAHPRLGEGETKFVRHRWARRYILRVLDDGTLRVTLPRWGSKREAQAFVERSEPWIAKQLLKREAMPTVARPDEPELRRRAAKELPVELLELAAVHGVSVTRVSIRDQRSRWGACSSRGSITLNWRLILVPAFVREYVMIHELMHRRELNHSRRFWRHVAAACPRVGEARKWLLENGPAVFAGREIC
jgi:predicted metal-dependent hydrolase